MDTLNQAKEVLALLKQAALWFTSAGNFNVGLKLGLVLLVGIGAFIYWRWLKKRAIEAANQETTQGRIEDAGGVVQQNKKAEDDAEKAQGEVRKK